MNKFRGVIGANGEEDDIKLWLNQFELCVTMSSTEKEEKKQSRLLVVTLVH